MMVLLLSIATISFVFRELVEGVVMVFVVAAYISVEFLNKFRADRTMAKLRELTQPTTRVIREGKEQMIPTVDVVVCDLIVLSAGVRIAADARLIESKGLLLNEASLTGESQPVRKEAGAIVAEKTNIAERVNSTFSGTTVFDGEGKAVVLAVGAKSELGNIAGQVGAAQKEHTPLQQAMTKLVKNLALVVVIISAILPAIGFLRGLDPQQMVMTWLALTFLMVPGQPPVIITMALALASFELARKNVVVKRLGGAETLGSVTSIVTDKTGTLTENRMRVEKFFLPDGETVAPQNMSQELVENISLALPEYINDPTDEAVAQVVDFTRNRQSPIFFEGFSEGHPWRTLIYKSSNLFVHVVAGKPELLIESSTLSSEKKELLRRIITSEGNLGKRVVAYATFKSKTPKRGKLDPVDFLALAVLEDPVREGAREAVTGLADAGIETYIVTGDHPSTTKTVGENIGLFGKIVTGDQLEEMGEKELNEIIQSVRLFARTSPFQKLRLVKALKSRGESVAVIGDGVNDAQ